TLAWDWTRAFEGEHTLSSRLVLSLRDLVTVASLNFEVVVDADARTLELSRMVDFCRLRTSARHSSDRRGGFLFFPCLWSYFHQWLPRPDTPFKRAALTLVAATLLSWTLRVSLDDVAARW